jgi:signal transduction histidine kinase
MIKVASTAKRNLQYRQGVFAMKLNKVSIPIIFVLIVSIIAIWKLNEFYRQDLILQKNRIIEQQSTSLVGGISGYLSQLKNILSSYENGVVESQINWMQIKPFFILARAEMKNKKINVLELFAHSDSLGKSWTANFLNQALSFFTFSDHSISTKLFKNRNDQKFLALVFADGNSSGNALVLVSEADVLQKLFNVSSSQNIIYSLLTADQIVAAHSQPSYVATVSQERKNKNSGALYLSDQIRGTDLTLISYSLAKVEQQFFVIPFSVLGIILGTSLVLIGVLACAYIPIENMIKDQKMKNREEQYSKTLKESKQSLQNTNSEIVEDVPPMEPFMEEDLVQHSVSMTRSQIETPSVQKHDVVVQEKPAAQTQTGFFPAEGSSIGSFGFYEIVDLVEIALRKMNTVFKENKISVIKNLAGSAKIELDPDRFVKSICNVLMNSVDATKGRDRREIEVSFHEKDQQIFLAIADSGVGIKDEDKEKIWQPFYTTKNKKNHKGLGLSEAISISRRYGFELTVRNNPSGVGAIAEFSSQLNRVPEASLNSSEDSSLNLASSSVEISDGEIDRILSLEDVEIKELQPTHFKINPDLVEEESELVAVKEFKVPLEENPEINIEIKEKKIDLTSIQIRKPTKDRAGRG